MKLFLFLLTFVFSCAFAKAEPFSGTLQKGKKSIYIKLEGKKHRYKILNVRSDAQVALNKLDSGDYLIGTADLDEDSHTLNLSAIDYVGLQKILGVWYNNKNVMNFKNFTDLSVYPLSLPFKNNEPGISLPSTDIRYSLAPYNGNQWAIFLSNSESTVFATIELGFDSAKMHLYNSETGDNTDTVILTRWRK